MGPKDEGILDDAASSRPQVAALLEELRRGGQQRVDRGYRIYCNRDLNLADVDAIGFDMDYTLARYKQEALDRLSVELTLERLVRERGYPEDLLEIEPRPNFAIRGLVIDKLRGNIFKMDSHRHVGRVYHGFRQLDEEESAEYRREAIRLNSTARFALIDTLFALPEAFLYAALVDYFNRKEPGRQHDWPRLFADIRYSIDLAHRDDSIKDAIIADTESYVERSETLARTLHKFRSAGKKLFLMTNSFARYTEHIMKYLLDGVLPEYPSWRNYFDVCVTGSRKPYFFTERNPFLIVDERGRVLGEEYQSLERGQLYQGGNLLDFERMANLAGERIVYIGDHIYGDIVRSRKSSAWRTVMVVQEMQEELAGMAVREVQRSHLYEIEEELARLSEDIAYEQWVANRVDQLLGEQGTLEESSALLGELGELSADVESLQELSRELRLRRDQMRRRRKELLDNLLVAEADFEEKFNPWWGPIFKLGNKNSTFGEQVADYACLYTSRVANFFNYSPLHYFRAPREPMAHEL